MLSEKDIIYQAERYKDYMREADRDRLVRQATSSPAPQNRLYARALMWLGRQLVAYGCRLLRQCGNVTEMQTLPLGNSRLLPGTRPGSEPSAPSEISS